LVCDSEVSDALRSEVSIAEALKHDGRANELLAPLGVEKAYKNFFHIVDDLAPRYTFSSGVYTEVLPYTTEAADPANGKFGIRLIENTAYETATHTRSYIFQRDVYKMLYPNTVTSAAAGVTFDPVMYRGDWKWLNVVNVDKNSTAYNPDGTIGFFRGVFASATKAIKPEQGFTVIHKPTHFFLWATTITNLNLPRQSLAAPRPLLRATLSTYLSSQRAVYTLALPAM
jgi:hypothetical protein